MDSQNASTASARLFAGDGRDQCADLVDVALLVAIRFRRQRVRAEEARDHVDVARAREAPRGAQHPHFSLALEPIPRLDLDGGDAFREQSIEAGQARAHEIVLARRPRRLHGGDDAAARPRDLLVGGAGKAQLEFVRPISGIDEVGVAIDQAGRDPASVHGDAIGRIPTGRQFRHRTCECNTAGRSRNCAALDNAQTTAVRREGGKTRVEPDRVEPHDVLAQPMLYT